SDVLLNSSADDRYLHSFPTRRSSDLFLASIMDAGGNVPMIGDADDGFAVRLDPRKDFCRYRSLLATGALLFGGGDFKAKARALRSEEHTSELQSRSDLVCRLLLEKKK